jgi:kynurenine formamidase
VPLEDLTGPAAVIDVRSLAEEGESGINPLITADRVRGWEEEHGSFRADEVVLFRTGWDRY